MEKLRRLSGRIHRKGLARLKRKNRLHQRSVVGPYFGEDSVRGKPINGSVFRWGVGPLLAGDSSLDETIDTDAESAWEAEIVVRLKEIDEGKVNLVPWAEARARIAGR